MQEALLAAATQWPADGRPDEPAGLAGPGGLAAPDRPVPQRRRPRRRARTARGARGRAEPPEPAPDHDDTLILMFMCCHPALTPALGHPAHAARGRRPDHARDRRGVPGSRGDDGPADQPGQAEHQAVGRAVRAAAAGASGRTGSRSVLHVLYLIFNEGYSGQQRRRAGSDRPLGRGDPADPKRHGSLCPTTPRSPACSRSCCSPKRGDRPGPAPTAS